MAWHWHDLRGMWQWPPGRERTGIAAPGGLGGLLCLLLLPAQLAAQELRFSIGEWAPYTSEAIDNRGMATELVAAACLAEGLRPSFEFVPWKRAESYVSSGDCFGTFPYLEIPERQGRFLFSNALFTSSFAIMRNRTNGRSTGLPSTAPEAFKGLKVGITAGTDAVRLPLEKAGALVEETPSVGPSIQKLAAGRIDFVIDDKAVLFHSLKELRAKGAAASLEVLEAGFGEAKTFKVMVSPKFPDSARLLQRLNEGLRKIRADGTYRKILVHYGLTR